MRVIPRGRRTHLRGAGDQLELVVIFAWIKNEPNFLTFRVVAHYHLGKLYIYFVSSQSCTRWLCPTTAILGEVILINRWWRAFQRGPVEWGGFGLGEQNQVLLNEHTVVSLEVCSLFSVHLLLWRASLINLWNFPINVDLQRHVSICHESLVFNFIKV